MQKLLVVHAGNTDEISSVNSYLSDGWQVVQMVSENVSICSKTDDSYGTENIKGKILIVIQK